MGIERGQIWDGVSVGEPGDYVDLCFMGNIRERDWYMQRIKIW